MKAARYLLRALLLLVLLLLAAPLALVGVLASEGGSAWVLRQAAELAGPQGYEIGFDAISGSLLGRLELAGVSFAGAGARVEAGRVLLHWRPWALTVRRLHIRALEVADLRVVPPPPVETAPAAPSAPAIPDIALPLAVHLERFELRDLEVDQGDSVLAIQRVAFAARADQSGLTVDSLDFAGAGLAAKGRLGLRLSAPHQIDGVLAAQVDESLSGPEVGAVALNAVLRGAALNPDLDVRVTAPAELRLHGALDLRQVQPGFDLSADWRRLDWPLQGTPQVSAGDGRVTLQGGLDDYRLQLATNLSGEGLPAGAIELLAQGDLQGIRLQPLRIDVLDGQLVAHGSVAWHEALQLDLAVSAEGLNPSLYLAELPGRVGGRLTLKGGLDDYRLELQTSHSGGAIPPGTIDLAAHGDLQSIALQPLRIGVLDGQLLAEGSVGWAEGVRWDIELSADKVNPAGLLPDLPGRIGGRLTVSGGLGPGPADPLIVKARIRELAGQLRDYPVSAGGEVDLRGADLEARGLRLASGSNRVDVDGRVGDRLDLRFDIDAPELAAFYPGLAGQLRGTGRVEGTRAAPVVVAKLSGNTIAYQDLQAQSLALDIDWRDTGSTGQLRASGLLAGGFEASEVALDLDGTPQAHRIGLSVMGPRLQLAMRAQGGVGDRAWTGTLDSLDLTPTEPALGEWSLPRPTGLTLGAERARADRLCLAQDATSVCVAGGWDAASGLDATAELDNIDLARLGPYLPDGATVEGSVAGRLSVSGDPARPKLAVELRPSDGLIRVEGDDQPFELAYRNVRVDGRFEDDRGSADLRLELGPNGRASGQVTLGADQNGQRALGGELSANFPDLGLVAGFVPQLQAVEGRLELQARLGGTLAAPRVVGGLQVADAQARVPDVGIALRDIQLDLRGEPDGPLRLGGQVLSGEGRLDIAGVVDLAAAGGPAVDLTVKGDRFQVARLPEAEVEVSPDLRLAGAAPYHLSGVLKIPLAKIELKDIPSGTVAVSDDVIVVGETEEAPPGPRAQNLTAKVRVELGDEVTFRGFGLTTGLAGALDAAVDAKGTAVDGKIEMVDGQYRAYGQELTVDRGRLLFAGPPGDPDVDLRALRVSRDGEVKAYLAMSGPLSQPRPRVYSEPALPEAEALAYLLTGNGLDQAGQQDGTNIASAAASLGMSQGEPLLRDLSDRLGLDDLRVDSGSGGLEESALVVGKYLNPDLYLGYSQGLFNPEGAVLLRLRLNERLDVESRSGNEQSVDLFYRFEHD